LSFELNGLVCYNYSGHSLAEFFFIPTERFASENSLGFFLGHLSSAGGQCSPIVLMKGLAKENLF
jgi:hypothetical protein